MFDLDTMLDRIAHGDTLAFGDWAAAAEPALRRSLLWAAASVDTEAVLQETLLRVWQVAPRVQLDGKPNALLRLAQRIARNLALGELRRPHHRRKAKAPPVDERSVEATPPDPLLREAIEVCREKLPAKPAAALMARLSPAPQPDATLASQLGMKLNTFLQNVTRARRLLATCLQRAGVDLEAELR